MKDQQPLLWDALEPLLKKITEANLTNGMVTSVNWRLRGVQGQLVPKTGAVHINWCDRGCSLQLPAGTGFQDFEHMRHWYIGAYTLMERRLAPQPAQTTGYIHAT